MHAKILLVALLASYGLCAGLSRRHTTFSKTNPQRDSTERLSHGEALLLEKLDDVHKEVKENGRRIEWQSSEMNKFLEGLRMDLNRLIQQSSAPDNPRNDPELNKKIMNIEAGLQLLIAATRPMFADIETIKRNISSLASDTKTLLRSNQYLNNGVSESKQPGSCAGSAFPKNCREVKGGSGIYRIQSGESSKPLLVYCDMETRGGGWIVMQNRFDGTQDFYQNHQEYKLGFGNLGGEFWIGLENLHLLTGSDVSELLVELQDHTRENRTAYYSVFSVGSEDEGYPLKVLAGYSGNAGDSLSYHAGNRFSTKDLDQDAWPEGSCAQSHGGGWWYRSCDASNLNGKFLKGELPEQYIYQGMYWGTFRGAQYSLARSRMLIRPRDADLPLHEIFDMSPKAQREVQEEEVETDPRFSQQDY